MTTSSLDRSIGLPTCRVVIVSLGFSAIRIKWGTPTLSDIIISIVLFVLGGGGWRFLPPEEYPLRALLDLGVLPLHRRPLAIDYLNFGSNF